MTWSISDPVSGLSLDITPTAGDVVFKIPRTTSVLYALRGSSPYVSDGPARAVSITVPELCFRSLGQMALLEQLWASSQRLLLTDDTGRQFAFRFVGDLDWREADTPDRVAGEPISYCQINVVGVA